MKDIGTYAVLNFLPKIWADCSKNISVAWESLAMVHFYNDVCELCFIVQGFELLQDVTSMNSIYPIVVGDWKRSILYL